MKFIIHTLKGIRVINTKNIVFAEAEGNNTKFTLQKSTKADSHYFVISTKSLKENELELPEIEFYRCHRSYIINMRYFFEYDTANDLIILENGTKIKISRERKAETKAKLFKFLEFYNN